MKTQRLNFTDRKIRPVEFKTEAVPMFYNNVIGKWIVQDAATKYTNSLIPPSICHCGVDEDCYSYSCERKSTHTLHFKRNIQRKEVSENKLTN